jgi:hypothetical protein
MKKLLISLAILFSLTIPTDNVSALEPKQKAFMVMTTYGTVGGALLGFASMAFGSGSRSIAQGASLGLYAGIIFGSYVITSHRSAGEPAEVIDPYAPPQQDPYAEPPRMRDPYGNPGGGGGFGAPPPEDDQGGFFGSRVQEINMKMTQNFGSEYSKSSLSRLPIYINFYNGTF